MFDNIGNKIKILAKVICWLGIIGSVVLALTLISNTYLAELGLIVLVAGPILSWISSFFLYGFGELIDKACEIAVNTRSGNLKSPTQANIDQERIKSLDRLRSQDLITEEEYQQALTKI